VTVGTNTTARGPTDKSVLNMSIGGLKSKVLNSAIGALKNAGVTVVVAAGNDNVSRNSKLRVVMIMRADDE